MDWSIHRPIHPRSGLSGHKGTHGVREQFLRGLGASWGLQRIGEGSLEEGVRKESCTYRG